MEPNQQRISGNSLITNLEDDSASGSQFMLLPSEIRVVILGFLLCSDEPVQVMCDTHFICTRSSHHHGTHAQTHRLFPSILRVNRTLFKEGKSLLYSRNTLGIRAAFLTIIDDYINQGDAQFTLFDHTASLAPENLNSDWTGRLPKSSRRLFQSLHVHVQLEPGFHRLRAKSSLHELIVKLNEEFSTTTLRRLTLNCEGGVVNLCPRSRSKQLMACSSIIDCTDCKQFQRASALTAAKVLAPFSFLQNVSDVSLLCEVEDGQNLISQIKNPNKGPDLFPLYWALLCYIQRIPDDPFTDKLGLQWEKRCSEEDAWTCNEQDDLEEESLPLERRSLNEFRMSQHTEHWTCPVWLVNRMRTLRRAMDSGDEETFRYFRGETLSLISLVMDELRDSLVYMYEGGIRPPEEGERPISDWRP